MGSYLYYFSSKNITSKSLEVRYHESKKSNDYRGSLKTRGGRNTTSDEPLGREDLPANHSMKKVVGRTDHIFQ